MKHCLIPLEKIFLGHVLDDKNTASWNDVLRDNFAYTLIQPKASRN